MSAREGRRVRVWVATRSDLHDPEAEAIAEVLRHLSPHLRSVRLGRTFDLDFDGLGPEEAAAEAQRLAEAALRQPVLEEARLWPVPEEGGA